VISSGIDSFLKIADSLNRRGSTLWCCPSFFAAPKKLDIHIASCDDFFTGNYLPDCAEGMTASFPVFNLEGSVAFRENGFFTSKECAP